MCVWILSELRSQNININITNLFGITYSIFGHRLRVLECVNVDEGNKNNNLTDKCSNKLLSVNSTYSIETVDLFCLIGGGCVGKACGITIIWFGFYNV